MTWPDDHVDPETCDHRAPEALAHPGARKGEVLWCSQCGSICTVREDTPHQWETPARSRMDGTRKGKQ